MDGAAPRRPARLPSSSTSAPSSGAMRPSSTRARVVLPLPDSPTRPSVSPRSRLEVDADQGPHRLAADGEGLGQVPQRHDQLGRARRGRRQLNVRPGCSSAGPTRRRAGSSVRSGAGPDLEGRRRGLPAAVLGDRAARGEDAPGERVPGRRQEAGDRVQPPVVLALTAARDAAQQPDRVRVARLVEHLLAGALLDQFAGVQHPDPVAHLGDHRQVVADEQHRGGEVLARSAATRSSTSASTVASSAVVGSSRISSEGSAASAIAIDHPLRHPAGELVRVPPHHPARVGDLDRAQHGLGLAPAPPCGPAAGDLVHLGDLAADPDRRVQRLARFLVHHRHGAGPQARSALGAMASGSWPSMLIRPAADPAVARQVPGQRQRHRGLAGPGLADQAVRLAPADLERDVAQRQPVLAADPVGDVQVLDLRASAAGRRHAAGGRGASVTVMTRAPARSSR